MRNNLSSTKRVCQTDDNENMKCENVTVALFVLNFVWCVGFSKQNCPSHSLVS